MDWTIASQNFHVEALTPNMEVFRDGAFGRYLGLDEVIRVGLLWWD